MSILSDNEQQKVRQLLEDGLDGNVEVVFFTERDSPILIPGKEHCLTCPQTRELLEEVTALSDKLSLTVHELPAARETAFEHGVDRIPAIILKGAARGRVRFFGIPSGYEFSAFIDDLIDSSKGETDLTEQTRNFLGSLAEDVTIKVFTTPG